MELGGLMEQEAADKKTAANEIVSLDNEREKRRKAFFYWNVGGRDYQMKLTTGMIERLENKYRANIMNLVSDSGIPPLSIMLTVLQAAMTPWEHGVSYEDTKRLYDRWLEEGGSQMELYGNVLMPVLAVSGFFTAKQAEEILAKMENLDELL